MKSTKSRQSSPARKAAAALIADGYAVCLIEPGEKRPTYRLWTTGTIGPEDVRPGNGIGIVCGPLSGTVGHALMCADVDSHEAVRLADKYLPATGMVEGRAGKPRSHRWYMVPMSSIGTVHHSHAAQAAPVMVADYGHPGPRTLSFRSSDNSEVIRLIGTGGQAVVPPSLHSSGELREWDGGVRGEPAVVEFPPLLKAVRRLARKCGWVPKAEVDVSGTDTTDAPEVPVTTVGPFLTYRINRYLDELPASVSGRAGHNACYRAACVLVWDFALGEDDAIKFLRRFNARCRPKWSERELLHKVRDAAAATDHVKRRGHLV